MICEKIKGNENQDTKLKDFFEKLIDIVYLEAISNNPI